MINIDKRYFQIYEQVRDDNVTTSGDHCAIRPIPFNIFISVLIHEVNNSGICKNY